LDDTLYESNNKAKIEVKKNNTSQYIPHCQNSSKI